MNPSMLSPLYMAEISPPEVRGSLMALEQLSIVLGVVFGFWTGFITRSSMCISNIACSYHRSPDLTVSLSLNSSRFFVMARSARHPNHPRYHSRFRLLFPPPISPTIGSTPEVRWSSRQSCLLAIENARRSWIGSLVACTFLNCFQYLLYPYLFANFLDWTLRDACGDGAHPSFIGERIW